MICLNKYKKAEYLRQSPRIGNVRLGLISDIHANEPALSAVLADMPSVDTIVCAGDIVGYNPMPATCLERVQSAVSTVVQGNHDRTVESPQKYAGNPAAHAGLEYAQARLSNQQLTWLQMLPRTATVGNGEYLLVHSHPKRRGEYVFPDDAADLCPFLDEYSGIILGHTHIQYEKTVDGRQIINPGSVGQPRDGDRRAAYAILNTEQDTVELRRTHYDIDRAYHEIAISDLPTASGDRLYDGE